MESSTLRRIGNSVLLILTALVLLVAQSAFWLNHTIFDKESFTSIVTPIVNSNETRSAIASTVVERAFADRPLVNRLIGNNVTALITGLLGTDVAIQMTSALIDRTYNYLTTENPKAIALDLVAIKDPLQKITELLESRGRDVRIDPSTIPDAIVFFNPNDLPDLYKYSVILLWLGPLCWIVFLLLAALYIYLGRAYYPRRIFILGGAIIVVSCLGLLLGPLLAPPISAQVPIPALRSTVNALVTGLLAPFTQQMIIMIVLTSLILIVFYFRYSIVRGAQRVTQKVASSVSSTTPATAKSTKKKKQQ